MKKLLLCILTILLFQQVNSQPVNTNVSNGSVFDGEPYIAINPTNNKNLVAAWMGFKLGYHVLIKTRASFDGGNTWSSVNMLPHSVAGYTSADVSMAFDKNGLLYLSHIDSRQTPDSGGVYVVRSLNGGLTWGTPSKAFDMYDDAVKRPIDRPWLVVDNSNTTNSGTLYITTKPAPWIAPPIAIITKFHPTADTHGLPLQMWMAKLTWLEIPLQHPWQPPPQQRTEKSVRCIRVMLLRKMFCLLIISLPQAIKDKLFPTLLFTLLHLHLLIQIAKMAIALLQTPMTATK